MKALRRSACVSLEQVPQVEERSVVLRVNVQGFPVVTLRLLGVSGQSAQVVHGAGVPRVQPDESG